MPTQPVTTHDTDASVHLDALRGVAALVVFLSHLRAMYFEQGLRDFVAGTSSTRTAAVADNGSIFGSHLHFASLLQGHQSVGRFAVIVFFVLSGYFVGGSALRASQKGKFSLSSYAVQRITRLWVALIPALLLGLVLDLIGSHYLPGAHNIYHSGGIEFSAGLAQRLTPAAWFGSLFFLQGIATPIFGTNLPLWSLAYEFWFYAMFPLLLLAFAKSTSAGARAVSGLLFCVCALISGWAICAYFLVWGCGVVVSMLPLNLGGIQRRTIAWSATALLFAAMFLELKKKPNLWIGDMILGLIVTAIVWTILHLQGSTVSKWYRWPAQGLSKMSYTLYVVHVPILVFISAILFPVWGRWKMTPAHLGAGAAVFAVTFGAAWGMYFLFERNTASVRRFVQSLLPGSAATKPSPHTPAATRTRPEASEVAEPVQS